MRTRPLSAICAAVFLNSPFTAVGASGPDLPAAALAPVSVEITGAGTIVSEPAGIACPGSCTAMFPRGRRVTLTAAPDSGGSFLTYTGDCAGTQPSCEVLVNNSTVAKAFFSTSPTEVPDPIPENETPDPIPQLGTAAPVPQTGQEACFGSATGVSWQENQIDCAGSGQDGAVQAGVPSPNPRFTDQENGTIRDNLTGLVWLKDADCFGTQNWSNGLTLSNNLADGTCGLTDGSQPGDWRLPNIKEFLSLISYQAPDPNLTATQVVVLPEAHPFSNADNAGNQYWTSTSLARNFSSHNAYVVFLGQGEVLLYGKGSYYPRVWPVRDPK